MILPFKMQYIFSLFQSVVNNKDQYKPNSEIHSINTRPNLNIYQPLSDLTMHQEGTYFFSIYIFNNFPSDIKTIVSQCSKISIGLVIFFI